MRLLANTLLLPFLFMLLMMPPAVATGALEPVHGEREFPNLELKDLDRRVHRLSDYRGKVVLVNFWASWCTPCVTEIASMKRLSNRLSDQPFVILAINVSEPENRIRKFAERITSDFVFLMDHDALIFRTWQVQVLPTSYVLDADNRIRYEAVGAIEWDAEEVVTLIEDLLFKRQ